MTDGRIVVITGAAGGIRRKIVDRFLANGDRVIGLDRAPSLLEDFAASRNAGDQLATACVDITDGMAVSTFAESVHQTHEHVDVLVNCAGFYPVVPFEQMTLEQWALYFSYVRRMPILFLVRCSSSTAGRLSTNCSLI